MASAGVLLTNQADALNTELNCISVGTGTETKVCVLQQSIHFIYILVLIPK